jgi:hypothetical protein
MFTYWILKIRNNNYNIIKTNFLTFKNNDNINIIFDPSKNDGLGTIYYNLLIIMNLYKNRTIYLLDNFIPFHDKTYTLKDMFPNIKFINKKSLYNFITIDQTVNIFKILPLIKINNPKCDIIYTGTNSHFININYKSLNLKSLKLNSFVYDITKNNYKIFLSDDIIKIAVHIRRGDYLDLIINNTSSFVCINEDNYYINNIINLINKITKT